VSNGCPECERMRGKVRAAQASIRELALSNENLQNVVGDLERDLRGKRLRIRQLEADKDLARQTHPLRPVVERVFRYWQKRCHHPRARLDGERFDAILWALELYSKNDGIEYAEGICRMAIDGAAHDPFIVRGKRFDAVTLIFRNSDKLEDFANRGARVRAR
jgi:hypothetical protein